MQPAVRSTTARRRKGRRCFMRDDWWLWYLWCLPVLSLGARGDDFVMSSAVVPEGVLRFFFYYYYYYYVLY